MQRRKIDDLVQIHETAPATVFRSQTVEQKECLYLLESNLSGLQGNI
jgi:hypothetical protein